MKKKIFIPLFIIVGVIVLIAIIFAALILTSYKRIDDMVFYANTHQTTGYPDGTAFVDYDDYMKLVVVDDFNEDEYTKVSVDARITGLTIGSISWSVHYTVKRYESISSSVLTEDKVADCDICFEFKNFQWYVTDISVK